MYRMVFPLVPDPRANSYLPNLQVFWILSLSEAPMYLNSDSGKKLQECQWLISATLPEFNHLQGSRDPAATPSHNETCIGQGR
jgi:uncharacterized protein (DUF1810 family)